MIPPRRILSILDQHWAVIERLINRYALSSFSIQDLQNVLKWANPDWNSETIYKEAQKLLQNDVVISLAKSSQYELNRAIQEFAQYLLKEHQLGLAEELHVLVNDLKRRGDKLEQSGKARDNEELRRHTRIMDDRVRQITRQFAINESAILNIVEQAKKDETSIALHKRYAAVIEAFDEYISPVMAMVDVNGDFKLAFDKVELQISELIDDIVKTGHLHSEKELLIQLRTRILDMHLNGRESLSRSAAALMPLREELRKNTLLTRQASHVLSLMRKKGTQIMDASLPIIGSENKKFSLGTKSQMTAFMAELSNFQEKRYELPDLADIPAYTPNNPPDFSEIMGKLEQAPPTGDLFNWLNSEFSELEVDDLLFIYQKMSSEPSLSLRHQNKTTVQVKDFSVTLHPLETCETDAAENH